MIAATKIRASRRFPSLRPDMLSVIQPLPLDHSLNSATMLSPASGAQSSCDRSNLEPEPERPYPPHYRGITTEGIKFLSVFRHGYWALRPLSKLERDTYMGGILRMYWLHFYDPDRFEQYYGGFMDNEEEWEAFAEVSAPVHVPSHFSNAPFQKVIALYEANPHD
jgi:hypothetical protein